MHCEAAVRDDTPLKLLCGKMEGQRTEGQRLHSLLKGYPAMAEVLIPKQLTTPRLPCQGTDHVENSRA